MSPISAREIGPQIDQNNELNDTLCVGILKINVHVYAGCQSECDAESVDVQIGSDRKMTPPYLENSFPARISHKRYLVRGGRGGDRISLIGRNERSRLRSPQWQIEEGKVY